MHPPRLYKKSPRLAQPLAVAAFASRNKTWFLQCCPFSCPLPTPLPPYTGPQPPAPAQAGASGTPTPHQPLPTLIPP